MDNNKVSSNDVLEALSMRLNDTLRPSKKDNKKNNAYFWMFKFLLLIIFIILICGIFNCFRELGVSIIYLVGKSLRSVLSTIWVSSINFMKHLLILCLLFEHFKLFITSDYYKILYKEDKKMLKKKEKAMKVIDVIFKIEAVLFMLVVALLAALSMFALIYMIIMIINGTIIISPIIIMLAIFIISYFTFKYIQFKFFYDKVVITKVHFVAAFLLLLAGIVFLGYEIHSFEYKNDLPTGFEITNKVRTFKIDDNQIIRLKNDSKLNNLKVLVDNELDGEIKVVIDYYKTAKVRYTYEFNEEDDLKLSFSSSLNFEPYDTIDIIKLFVTTFNNKVIYNYNMFKYPNIYVYVNSKDMNRVKVD